MVFQTSSPIFILLIIVAGREVHSRKPCAADQKEPWSYSGNNGPRFWGKIFPGCNGTNQSPIDINTSEVVNDNSLGPLEPIGYDEPISSANIKNNGHTVQLTPTDGMRRSIQGGALAEGYILNQFHFHWGSRSTRGSEHRINGNRYPMEMHLVHMKNNTEIAVFAIFFEESAINNPGLGPFVKSLKYIKYKGNQTTLQSELKLKHLLPPNLKYFYRYSGSLTTPGCNENVTWTVLVDTLPIGTAQLQEFRQLYSTPKSEEHQCYLVDNFRNIQPLNARVVTSVRDDWKR